MSLTLDVRRAATLQRAWFAIRANAASSKSGRSKKEAADFDYALPQNIKRIQDRLRSGYSFSKSHGALKPKKSGTGKRGLVIAPIEDRVVQRAILDVLQDHHAPIIRSVLETPTSFGGIPGRGVADAIRRIEGARRGEGMAFLAGSDISGFFTKIKVEPVVEFVATATGDHSFARLFDDALRVDLANASDLSPEDLALFPRAGIGVAQGCPLSAFAGNVFLRNFDAEMNQGNTICLRYMPCVVSQRPASAATVSPARASPTRSTGSPKTIIGISLIVIDTLTLCFGEGDENSTRDAGRAIASAKRIAELTGAHVMLVHHTGKDRNAGERGSYSITGNSDTVIELVPLDGEEKTVMAVQRKQREAATDPAVVFKIIAVELGEDEDGETITTSGIEVIDSEADVRRVPAKKTDRGMEAVLTALRALEAANPAAPGFTAAEIADACAETFKVGSEVESRKKAVRGVLKQAGEAATPMIAKEGDRFRSLAAARAA